MEGHSPLDIRPVYDNSDDRDDDHDASSTRRSCTKGQEATNDTNEHGICVTKGREAVASLRYHVACERQELPVPPRLFCSRTWQNIWTNRLFEHLIVCEADIPSSRNEASKFHSWIVRSPCTHERGSISSLELIHTREQLTHPSKDRYYTWTNFVKTVRGRHHVFQHKTHIVHNGTCIVES